MASESVPLGTGRTGGREATTGVIEGRYALAVGRPNSVPPKGWKWTKLTDVATLESGHTPSRRHPEYWDGSIPWIGIKDANDNHGRVIHDTIQHVTELGLANSSARLLPAQTVCLSRTASIGFVTVMGRPMATSQDFVNWVCGPLIDHTFLKYVLIADREALFRFAHGTTHQTIYFPEAKAFHVCLPPIAEQKRIAHILGTLDDKIELNRRMNATLEALARALFQSWFVDFDPVRAKAAGQTPAALDPATATLFPSEFEDSALGEIPKGWMVKAIGEVVTVRGGGTPSTKNESFWSNGTHCWATPKDLSSLQHPILLSTERRITDAGVDKISSGVLPIDTVLLSSRAPVGYLALAKVPTAINQGFIAIECDGPLKPHYVLHWLDANMDEIKGRASGTTFAEISKSAFRPIPAIVPPLAVVQAFEDVVKSVFDMITQRMQESRTLAALRDALLPKLLSGELRVADGEQPTGRNY